MELEQQFTEAVTTHKKDGTLQVDGERFVPWLGDPVINYEHLHRYRFAKEFVKGKMVLDLACGEGYGSYMLAEEASKVIGVDIDESTIKHASTKYVKDNLKFMKSSMMEVTIKARRLFDVIICFEALEHTEEQDKVMAEVKRLLKDDGIFVTSMPNKYIYSDQANYKNPWHKRELYLDEFKTLLKSTFNNVLIYGQKVFPTSNIFAIFEDAKNTQELAIEKSGSEFSFVSLDKKDARYFIAVASDHLMKAIIGSSYMVDTSESLFRKNAVLEENVHGELEAVCSELETIYNSHGWKFLTCYYKFRDKIFPANSRRRAHAKSLREMVIRMIKAFRGGWHLFRVV